MRSARGAMAHLQQFRVFTKELTDAQATSDLFSEDDKKGIILGCTTTTGPPPRETRAATPRVASLRDTLQSQRESGGGDFDDAATDVGDSPEDDLAQGRAPSGGRAWISFEADELATPVDTDDAASLVSVDSISTLDTDDAASTATSVDDLVIQFEVDLHSACREFDGLTQDAPLEFSPSGTVSDDVALRMLHATQTTNVMAGILPATTLLPGLGHALDSKDRKLRVDVLGTGTAGGAPSFVHSRSAPRHYVKGDFKVASDHHGKTDGEPDKDADKEPDGQPSGTDSAKPSVSGSAYEESEKPSVSGPAYGESDRAGTDPPTSDWTTDSLAVAPLRGEIATPLSFKFPFAAAFGESGESHSELWTRLGLGELARGHFDYTASAIVAASTGNVSDAVLAGSIPDGLGSRGSTLGLAFCRSSTDCTVMYCGPLFDRLALAQWQLVTLPAFGPGLYLLRLGSDGDVDGTFVMIIQFPSASGPMVGESSRDNKKSSASGSTDGEFSDATAQARIPVVHLSEIVGRTILVDPQEDGQQFRARVFEATKEQDKEQDKDEVVHKFLVFVNDDQYEELLSSNDVVDHFRHYDNDAEATVWKFCCIVAHEGPLCQTDKSYKGSLYNVMVEWKNGETTFEQLSLIAADDPISCALYAKDHDLLELDGCKRFKKPQVKLRSFRTAPKDKYGYEVPRDYDHALALGKQNVTSPLEKGDHPEMDTSELLVAEGAQIYQLLIGALQWAVTLVRFTLATVVMTLSLFRCKITGRSMTGILGFVHQLLLEWYSKKQATVETATYGSEFVGSVELRNTLRYLGVPETQPHFSSSVWTRHYELVATDSMYSDTMNSTARILTATTTLSGLSVQNIISNIFGVPLVAVHKELYANRMGSNDDIHGRIPKTHSVPAARYMLLLGSDGDYDDVLSEHYGYQGAWPLLMALLFWGAWSLLMPLLFWSGDTKDLISQE